MSFLIISAIATVLIVCCLLTFFHLSKAKKESDDCADADASVRRIRCDTGDELQRLVRGLSKPGYQLDFLCPQTSEVVERAWTEDIDYSELKYFAMVIREQITFYRHEVRTKGVATGCEGALTVDSPEDLEAWLRQTIQYMSEAVQGFKVLINDRFPEAFGAPGVESDKQGLLALGCAYARLCFLIFRLDKLTRMAQTSRQCRPVLNRMANLYRECCNRYVAMPSTLLDKIAAKSMNPNDKEIIRLQISPYLDEHLLDSVTAEVRRLHVEWDYTQRLELAEVVEADDPATQYHFHVDKLDVSGDYYSNHGTINIGPNQDTSK